jgi:cyclopropane fatty-acyl-phospholipid synthase-like methyltransferase
MGGGGDWAGVSPHYLGERGERYATLRQQLDDHAGHRFDAAFFLPHLDPSWRVLDFGCGGGGMMRALAPAVRRVEGLEVNPAARRHAERDGLRVWARLADLDPAAPYDAIVSNHVLEHVPDPWRTLAALRPHLREGGLLVLKLPLDDWRSRRQRAWAPGDVDNHLYAWTPRTLANLLAEAGYRPREVAVVTYAWHPRLFPLERVGLHGPAFRLLAALLRRRQLLCVAERA